MNLWRVSNYATMNGVGGLRVSGRWHTEGHPVFYCAMTSAGALLETLVQLAVEPEDRSTRFQMLRIEGPETSSLEIAGAEAMEQGWASDVTVTRRFGDKWLTEKRTLLLQVPSVLVPESWNVIVNPLHPESGQLRITAIYRHNYDQRFFK